MSPSSGKKDAVEIQLPEVIDERTDLAKIIGQTKPAMHVDCGAVKRINSVGIRTLMLNLARLKKEGAHLVFSGLTPPMVEAITFISNLLPKDVKVESVYVPYSCNECGHGFMDLKTLDELKKKLNELETAECTKCGKTAEFDHVAELYFKWIEDVTSE